MSNAIAAKLNSKDQFSFDEMLAVLKIKKDEKGRIGAQNQTQFDYVQQKIFEATGQTWKWDGAPKDGKWVKVSDTAAASAKPKATKKQSKKDRRFTLEEAAAYYSEQSGKQMSAATLKANAKKYGFEIRERGSGLYALIDS